LTAAICAPARLAEIISQGLRSAGLEHEIVAGGEALLQRMAENPPSLLLVGGNGALEQYRTVRGLREAGHTPVLLLLDPSQANLELKSSFDDFLLLPLRLPELAARVQIGLSRAERARPRTGLSAGDLAIDFERFEASVRGIPLDLTFKEFELLKYLVSHPGRVLTREALLREVWGYEYFGGTRTVDVHIRRVRSKLGPEHESLIQTVRNVGYRFSEGK